MRRARRLAVEIGPDELRMDENDARELLRTVDVQLPDADLVALVELTEGWPGGLYLAALAIKSTIRGQTRSGSAGMTASSPTTCDRLSCFGCPWTKFAF